MSPSGHEMQFATNHLGHFALALGLHDALAAADGARIVSVSSGGPPALTGGVRRHRLRVPRLRPVRRLRPVQDRQRAVRRRGHPSLGRRRHHLERADARRDLRPACGRHVDAGRTRPRADEAARADVKTVEQGAATSVLLATSPLLDGVGGRYFEDCNEAPVSRTARRARRRRRRAPTRSTRPTPNGCGKSR